MVVTGLPDSLVAKVFDDIKLTTLVLYTSMAAEPRTVAEIDTSKILASRVVSPADFVQVSATKLKLLPGDWVTGRITAISSGVPSCIVFKSGTTNSLDGEIKFIDASTSYLEVGTEYVPTATTISIALG